MFGAMPSTNDGIAHLHRLITLDHNIRHGQLWPRYAPAAVFGYGAPSFNFYSPVSLYLAEILHLTGLSFLNSLLLALIVYACVGALGAYTLGKSWGGPIAGIGMATAMIYAPYMVYNMIHRCALAEYAALSLIPWAMWAFRQIALHGRRRDFVLAILFYSLIVLLHNITALVGTALLTVYSLYLWWTASKPPQVFVQLIAAGILALGLTAFFWLPALAEADYVQIGRVQLGVAAPPDSPNFDMYFQSLNQTLAWPETTDLTRLNLPTQITLGWPAIILGLAGLGLASWKRQSNSSLRGLRSWLAIMAFIIVFAVFMTTRLSTWFWLHIPLIKNLQFPWRSLGMASMLLALLAGTGLAAIAQYIPQQSGRIAWVILCVTTMMLYAMPWLYRQYLPNPPASNILDTFDYERRTGAIEGAAYGEFLPRWVIELPNATRLTGLYAQSDIIPRLQPLPGVVTVEQATWGITQAHLTFTSTEDTTLTFDWLYFPGWWAEMDGTPIEVFPTEPNGFVGMHIPAGEHSLDVGFGPTPLRLGATITTGIFLLVLLAVLSLAKPLWQQTAHPATSEVGLEPSSWPVILSVAVVGILLFVSKSLLIDNLQTPIKRARFANGIEAGLQTPIQANFEGQIDLLGYDINTTQLMPGQMALLTLYWQPSNGEISGDYSTVVRLHDAAGTIVAQSRSTYPGDWATSYWISGFHVVEDIALTIPPAMPPGEYTLNVSLFWYANNRALNTFDKQGTPLGTTVPIGNLTIIRPVRTARISELKLDTDRSPSRLDAPMTDDIHLVAANELPATSEVGQLFVLLTYWQAHAQPEQSYAFRVLWLDKDDQVAAASPSTSLVVRYPTDQWESGDIWKGIHPLYVPGRLEAGDYTVALQLFDGEEETGERVDLGQISISTPPRTFQVPTINTTTDATWENNIRLRGYDLLQQDIRQGNGLELTLYWQPEADVTTSLTVFVHVYDADGNTVAQQDSIPLSGTRPTTGWAPGEILTDRYAILVPTDVPPGRYWIRVGLYNATTGERIKLSGGHEFWVSPESIRVTAK